VNQALRFEDLPAATKRQLEGELAVIPGKWEVYAKVLLLVMTLNSLAEAKWVINRLRRELDRMGKKAHKEKRKEDE